MLATPLQMALVAATIANGGVEPKPYLVQKIVAADGSTVSKTAPQTLGRVIKPQTAAELNRMMQLVVEGGTGTAAQIPGVAVAGKTGTAEIGNSNIYNAWFVCFAPAIHPRYVVAVVVEKQLERLRRLDLGADRQGHPRKTPAPLNMSLPFRRPWR